MAREELPAAFQRRPPLIARQPFKAVWVTATIASLFIRIPFRCIYYVPRHLRQNSTWTWFQSLAVWLVRFNFKFHTSIRSENTVPSKPGKSSGPPELFELIEPVSTDNLKGIASAENTSVRPEARPGTWYPSRYEPEADAGKKVLLFFFGGAYVLGTHVPSSGIFKETLDLLLPALGNAKYFGVGYRLASTQGNHFPAQLIDALSAYTHLLNVGIRASDIILMGDSVGANLCMALIRYLIDHPNLNLQLPAAALLESGWFDLAVPTETLVKHPNYPNDALPREFLEWGTAAAVPDTMSLTDPYISPALQPFRTAVPLYVAVGDGEIFLEQIVRFAREMQEVEGNDVQLRVVDGSCHAVFMYGMPIGFARVVRAGVEAMRSFLAERKVI